MISYNLLLLELYIIMLYIKDKILIIAKAQDIHFFVRKVQKLTGVNNERKNQGKANIIQISRYIFK